MFGASTDPYLPADTWQFGVAARGLSSDDHYRNSDEQHQRHAQGTYVVNEQFLLDLAGTYAFTRRFSLTASVPLVNASWSIPMPTMPTPGPRSEQNAQGIGDVIVSGRFWTLDPEKHRRGNLAIGFGIKAPTGDYRATDYYPDIATGTIVEKKAVDMSIQPGDGGWGALFDIQGFKSWKRMSFYGSGSYLLNPKNTNGTPSIIVGLGVSGAATADRDVNTVPDQYLARAGLTFALGQSAFAGSLGLRVEGVPRHDLSGASNGFRRPGYEVFAEPALFYTRGADTFSLSVPIGIYRKRVANPNTGLEGDATFPDAIVLVGYTHRFGEGAASAPQARAAECDAPATGF